MKTFSSLKKFFLFLWTLFLCFNLNAQMILVSETDFSVAGGEDDYWHSTDMVDGYGRSSRMREDVHERSDVSAENICIVVFGHLLAACD